MDYSIVKMMCSFESGYFEKEAFLRCINLDALKQWAGLAYSKENLLKKLYALDVTTHMTCPVRNLWSNHPVGYFS